MMDSSDVERRDEEVRALVSACAQAIYRLSGTASFDAALAFELRKKATEIVSGVAALRLAVRERVRGQTSYLCGVLHAMEELISLALSLGFMTRNNAEKVLSAFGRIRSWAEEYGVRKGGAAAPSFIPGAPPFAPNPRQERILAFLGGNGRVQITDIREMFGQTCSEKTLRRDLWQLISAGLIRRQGGNRWTTYFSRTSDVREKDFDL